MEVANWDVIGAAVVSGAIFRRKSGAGDDGNGHTVIGYGVLSRNEYFAGHLITWNGVGVVTDRLGSIRAAANGDRYTYYPYGEQHTATGTGTLGLYADLISPDRNYDTTATRWNVPDRLGLSEADPKDPGGWNRFAYVQGDPINFIDSAGTNRYACVSEGDCGIFDRPSGGLARLISISWSPESGTSVGVRGIGDPIFGTGPSGNGSGGGASPPAPRRVHQSPTTRRTRT